MKLASPMNYMSWGVQVERQKPVVYCEVKLDCNFRADMVVEGEVVVELKCKEALHPRGPRAIAFAPAPSQFAGRASH
jgi:GxxExxY protein